MNLNPLGPLGGIIPMLSGLFGGGGKRVYRGDTPERQNSFRSFGMPGGVTGAGVGPQMGGGPAAMPASPFAPPPFAPPQFAPPAMLPGGAPMMGGGGIPMRPGGGGPGYAASGGSFMGGPVAPPMPAFNMRMRRGQAGRGFMPPPMSMRPSSVSQVTFERGGGPASSGGLIAMGGGGGKYDPKVDADRKIRNPGRQDLGRGNLSDNTIRLRALRGGG